MGFYLHEASMQLAHPENVVAAEGDAGWPADRLLPNLRLVIAGLRGTLLSLQTASRLGMDTICSQSPAKEPFGPVMLDFSARDLDGGRGQGRALRQDCPTLKW